MWAGLWLGVAGLLALPVPALAALDTSAAYVEASARAHCTRLFPVELSTRAFCIRREREGAAKMRVLVRRHAANGEITRAIARCYDLFTEQGATGFATASFCAEREIEAWAELNR